MACFAFLAIVKNADSRCDDHFVRGSNPTICQATYLSQRFEPDEVDPSVASGTGERLCVLGRKPGTDNNVYLIEVVC